MREMSAYTTNISGKTPKEWVMVASEKGSMGGREI